jgi:hypothetical protein
MVNEIKETNLSVISAIVAFNSARTMVNEIKESNLVVMSAIVAFNSARTMVNEIKERREGDDGVGEL